jgi:hypothetical protein
MSKMEEMLGELLRRFREREIDPIRKRLEVIEQRAAFEARLAAIEQRMGIDSEPVSELPAFSEWRGRQ